MGILRLGDFLKKSYPHLYTKKPLSAFKNKTYAVDASSTIYSFLVKTISINLLSKPSQIPESTCLLILWEI
jgi:hypothetical protein